MKMKELEQRTGVNREVIRILLRKGLLPEPRRLSRNAAEYDESHVRAIAAVRELQSNGRLTLEEIRNAVDGKGLGGRNQPIVYQHLEELLTHRFGIEHVANVSIAGLEQRFPSAARDARAFATMGMLDLIETADGLQVSIGDAKLIEIWGQIREAGFVEETGFPPENIAFYAEAAELVARRELEIFFAGSAGRISEERAAAMLQTALPLMLDFFGLLRLKAFMHAVREALKPRDT